MKTFWGTVALLAVAVVSLTPAPATVAGNEEAIKKAVDRAKDYLKSHRSGNHWEHSSTSEQHHIGLTCLCVIALLEADVPRSDPVITSAASWVRSNLSVLNKRGMTTYNLAMAILLLDKLFQDGQAEETIKKFTIRLAAGQNTHVGGWGYDCPELTKAQESQWLKFLEDNETKSLADDVPKDIGQGQFGQADNSNTQFALLGLWIGRRHKVPVNYPLFLAERRFRKTQISDGWGYGPESGGTNNTTPSMTAAGLLALALGFGASNESGVTIVRSGKGPAPSSGGSGGGADVNKEPKEFEMLDSDSQVVRARQYIVQTCQTGTDRSIEHFFYFLWSLERVSVMFGWEKGIEGWDWYAWGSNWLLRLQEKDGGWGGGDWHTGGPANTAFCILFLKKADLIPDAKRALRKTVARTENPLAKKKPGAKTPDPKTPNAPVPPEPDLEEEKKRIAKEEEDQRMAAARKLADTAMNAAGKRQEDALAKLRDTQGKEYTIAMVEAIKKIGGGFLQLQFRDALADRLKRQVPRSIISYLQGDDKELKAAAAWAAAIKEPPIKEAIPDIIPLLMDPDEYFSGRAYDALKTLSGEDFGKSAEKWKDWWDKTNKPKGAAK